MTGPIGSALNFLIEIIFDLYIFIVILRLLLQFIQADFYNPFTQLVVKLTQPLVGTLGRIVPSYARINFAAVIVAIGLEALKISLLVWVKTDLVPHLWGSVIWGAGEMLHQIFNIYFYAVLIQVILSWLRPTQYNPVLEIIFRLTTPILQPMRRLIPPLGGIDLSPLPAMILLQLGTILICQPVMAEGLKLMVAP